MRGQRRRAGQHVKSAAQVRFLLSSGSPLSGFQKHTLVAELHTGAVKVRGSKRSRPRRRGRK